MKKVLAAAMFAMVSSTASAAVFPEFTVDPFNAFGGAQPGPFQANFLTGNSSSLITTPGTPTAHGEGWINFTAAVLDGTPVLGFVSGINNSWQIWGETSFDLNLTSGTYGLAGSTYDITAYHINFWVDPSVATPTTFVQASAAGGAATVTHGAGAFQVAFSDVISGIVAINNQGGTAVNSSNEFTLLAAGQPLFTAPNPFFDLSFTEFNNTSTGVTIDGAGNFISTRQSTGGIDFAQVPEPGVLALMGLGMVGLGFIRRRK